MADASELEPERIARREFTTTFRGFDQAEVRAFLTSVSIRLREAADRERDLLSRLDRSESRPVDLDRVDEHRLTELLGEETARIFDAAREAAAEIRAKAETKTAQLVREAQDEANRLTGDAAEVLRLRTSEAEAASSAIVTDAENERDRLLAEARAEAEAMRVEASADAEQVRSEATSAAEHLRSEAQQVLEAAEVDVAAALEQARLEGREMVAEAQIVRERILKDLARRRRSGKAQLEQLRAARERLLDAYALVRRTLEEATAELSVAVPEAKLAAEAAGRRVENDEAELSVEAIEAELDAGRVAGLPLLDTGEVPVTRVDPVPDSDLPTQASRIEPEEADLASDPVVEGPEIEPGPEVDLVADAEVEEPEPEQVPDRVLSLVPQPEPNHEIELVEDRPDEEPVAEAVEVEPEAEPEPQAEPEPESHDDDVAEPVAEAPKVVDELFARLRSEVPEPDLESETDPEADPAPEPESALDPAADELAPEPSDDTEQIANVTDDTSDDPDEVALERRDLLVADLEHELARILKRQLADDENDKLDVIRRRPARAVATEVLPTLEQHRAAFVEATTETLARTAAAGRVLVTDLFASGDSDQVIDLDTGVGDLVVEMVDSLLLPIRDRVSELAKSSDSDDALDGVRACYRRWKGSISELASQFVHTAFNRGIYASLPDGTTVRWVVDPGAGPCPDGEDDALEGPIAKGTPFPTGHLHPPAHPGCRCLLVPGDM